MATKTKSAPKSTKTAKTAKTTKKEPTGKKAQLSQKPRTAAEIKAAAEAKIKAIKAVVKPIEAAETNYTAQAALLHDKYLAVKLDFTWMGLRKSVADSQNDQVADMFDADAERVRTQKNPMDTRHPIYRKVKAAKLAIKALWEDRKYTVPYTETGKRLLIEGQLDTFVAEVSKAIEALRAAAKEMQGAREEIIESSKKKLGKLFNINDYPIDFATAFDAHYVITSEDAPEHLLRLNKAEYERQKAIVANRFAQTAKMVEDTFASELAKLVKHLGEKMKPDAQGEVKHFRQAALDNVLSFFQTFQAIGPGGSKQLEQLAEQAANLVKGVKAEDVRDQEGLRAALASEMAKVTTQLDTFITDAPRRTILRPAAKA